MVKQYTAPGSNFLEIGCGAGDFGITLAKRGYRGHLIDFSDAAIDMTRNAIQASGNTTRLTCAQCDVFTIDPREHRYDFIILFEVLEHVQRDAALLQRIHDLLVPGGFLLMSVPAREKWWGYDDIQAGHFRRYEKNTLTTKLQQAGFAVRTLYSYGFPFMNMLKPLRVAAFHLQRHPSTRDDKAARTKKSGVNIVRLPLLARALNRYTLYPFIQVSRLFQAGDLGEGYLCVAQKDAHAHFVTRSGQNG